MDAWLVLRREGVVRASRRAGLAMLLYVSLLACGGDGPLDAEVLGFQLPVPVDEPAPTPGHVWAALHVEVCAEGVADDGAATSRTNWLLELPDDTRLSPAADPKPTMPSPVFPNGTAMLSDGDCAGGWIAYAVPEGVRPEHAVFTGDGEAQRIALP
jgi:hypothetical protein